MAATDLTYLDIQNRCLAYGYGEVDRARFKTWINQVQSDIYTDRRWRWAEATENVVTVSGTQTVALSTLGELPLYWGRLKPTLNTVIEPRWVDENGYNNDWPRHALVSTDLGMPQAYSIFASTITLYPIPDAVYTYSLRYWHAGIDLDGDTDKSMIPREHRNILVWGALVHAAERDRDDKALARRTMLYDKALLKLRAANNAPQMETQKKAKMPGSYQGRYDGARGWRP